MTKRILFTRCCNSRWCAGVRPQRSALLGKHAAVQDSACREVAGIRHDFKADLAYDSFQALGIDWQWGLSPAMWPTQLCLTFRSGWVSAKAEENPPALRQDGAEG